MDEHFSGILSRNETIFEMQRGLIQNGTPSPQVVEGSWDVVCQTQQTSTYCERAAALGLISDTVHRKVKAQHRETEAQHRELKILLWSKRE